MAVELSRKALNSSGTVTLANSKGGMRVLTVGATMRLHGLPEACAIASPSSWGVPPGNFTLNRTSGSGFAGATGGRAAEGTATAESAAATAATLNQAERRTGRSSLEFM